MKVKIFFLLFIFMSIDIYSQVEIIESSYSSLFSTEQNKVNDIWKKYLTSWNGDDNDNDRCTYWEKHDFCDLLATEGFFNPSLYQLGFSNQVLNIAKLSDNSYNISSIFYWIGEQNHLNIMAITNVLANKQKDGSFLLSNYFTSETSKFKIFKQNEINYHYPNDYDFNKNEARIASEFYERIRTQFKLPTEIVNYYILENCTDIYLKKGFYFAPAMNNKDCAFFDSKNNIIYTTRNYGESHYHELIHTINKKYPTAHYLILSGLAIYHNDKNVLFSNSFTTLFKNLGEYIDRNKIKTFDAFDFPTYEESINGDYLSGAILVDLILQKGGFALLEKSLIDLKTNSDINNFIIEKLKISPTEFNNVVIKKIKEMGNPKFKTKLF